MKNYSKGKIKFILIAVLLISVNEIVAFELTRPDSTHSIKPRGAMIRSAIFPGWGHLYVHKPVKGLVYFSLEAYHVYKFVQYNDIYRYVKDTKSEIGIEAWHNMTETEKKEKIKDVTGYELHDATWRPREIRNKYAWWCVGFYIIGMLDAYVDAQLYYFPKDNVELTTDNISRSIGISFSWSIRR